MKRAAFAVCLALAVAGCASAPRKIESPPDSAQLMVDNALSVVGQPYRYGGAKPGGFDCSGLVAYAALGAGISVPRTAHEQLTAGLPVARRNLRAGDLVFMRLAHKELHVGIAIDSERFVHAPSRGGYIRVDSLNKAPYAKGFDSARRLVSAAPTGVH